MSTHNGEKYIKEAIDSILTQSFSNFEFVICNDHSTDNTLGILNDYGKLDNRIRVFDNTNKAGLQYSLNFGLKKCRGKYVARMDDDDISHLDRLERQYSFLEKNPSISLLGTNINFFDENGIYGSSRFKTNPSIVDVWKGKTFCHPTMMFKLSDIREIGFYNQSDEVTRLEDYDCWCNFYYHGFKGFNLKDNLLDFREDSNSFKRRTNESRIKLVKCMHKWLIRMKLKKSLNIFVLYEFMKIFVPSKLIQKYHQIVFYENQDR